MNTELLARVHDIDPAPSNDQIPDGVWNAQQVLQELQRRSADPATQGSRLAETHRATRRRGWEVAMATVVFVLLLIGGIGLVMDFNQPDVSPFFERVEPDNPLIDLTEPDGPTGSSIAPGATDVITIGDGLGSPLVSADGAIWVALQHQGVVKRIDATTLQVTDTIAVGVAPLFMFPSEDGLWVLDNDHAEVFLVDTSARQVADSIEIDRAGDRRGQATGPVLVGETLWVHIDGRCTPDDCTNPAEVVEVDLANRVVVSTTPEPGGRAWWAEAINGAIWSYSPGTGLKSFDVLNHETRMFAETDLNYSEECCIALNDAIWMVTREGTVQRFDLATGAITNRLQLRENLRAGVAAAGAIWVPWGSGPPSWLPGPTFDPGVVYRIDPETGEVTDVIPVGSQPTQPVFADGAIWVPNADDGTVSRIDVETRQVTHTIQVGNRPHTPSAINGVIWVPNLEDGTLTRIQTR